MSDEWVDIPRSRICACQESGGNADGAEWDEDKQSFYGLKFGPSREFDFIDSEVGMALGSGVCIDLP